MFNYPLKIEKHINNCLYEHYSNLIKKIPKERVLGIFAIGSMNYGLFQEDVSDVDTKAIIIPSWGDILNHICEKPHNSQIILESGFCATKDIRIFVKELIKSQINTYEILFTPFCYINPLYQEIWNQIASEEMREKIVYNNIKSLLSINIAIVKNHLNPNKLTAKKYSHAVRLIYASKKIINEEPFINCLWQEDIKEELIKIKQLDISKSDINYLIHAYDGTIELIDSYINILPNELQNNDIKNILVNWEKEIIFNQLKGDK